MNALERLQIGNGRQFTSLPGFHLLSHGLTIRCVCNCDVVAHRLRRTKKHGASPRLALREFHPQSKPGPVLRALRHIRIVTCARSPPVSQTFRQQRKINAEHVSVLFALDHSAALRETVIEAVTIAGNQIARTHGFLRTEIVNIRGLLPIYKLLIPRFGSMKNRSNRERIVATFLRSWGFRATGLPAEMLSTRILNECRSGGDFIRVIMNSVAESQRLPRWAMYDAETVLHAGRAKMDLPNALFVHIIRDGRDVDLSLEKMGGFNPMPWDRAKEESLVATALYGSGWFTQAEPTAIISKLIT
jgi:hypothetical protein